MRGVAAYPAQHCLRLGFLGAGVEGGGEGGEGGTHGLGMGREGVRGREGQPAAPSLPPSMPHAGELLRVSALLLVSPPLGRHLLLGASW